ncbi:MAG TPA: HlyD family efflux transporter periplasmic adaptor subunit [Tepidisphaeraceae bacterium]|jgi:RND family efflux transporter MFP subunit
MSRPHSAILTAALSTCLILAGAAPVTPGETVEKGYTRPSSRKELAFSFQGLIGEVKVKEGQAVKAGDVLMMQDVRIEEARLAGLTLDADRTLVIEAKKAAHANKIVQLKRKQDLFSRGALSESELQEAELDVVLAAAEVEVEKHQQQVKVADVKLQDVRVDQMTMKAPVDGIVEKLNLGTGEVADIDKPAIVLLKNDPLYIEIKTLKTAVVAGLKGGQELQVRYPGEEWRPAKINQISAEADARSGMQAIRLEIANPEARSAGLEVEVRVPAVPVTTAAK